MCKCNGVDVMTKVLPWAGMQQTMRTTFSNYLTIDTWEPLIPYEWPSTRCRSALYIHFRHDTRSYTDDDITMTLHAHKCVLRVESEREVKTIYYLLQDLLNSKIYKHIHSIVSLVKQHSAIKKPSRNIEAQTTRSLGSHTGINNQKPFIQHKVS